MSFVFRRAFSLCRAVCFALVGITVAFYVINLPLFYNALRNLCSGACAGLQLTPQQFHALAALGISLDAYAAYMVGVRVLFTGIFLVVALVLVIRKRDDGLALFVAVMLVTFAYGTVSDELSLLYVRFPGVEVPVRLLQYIGDVTPLIFLFIFPGGRLVPRWALPWLVVWCMLEFAHYLLPNSFLDRDRWPQLLSGFEFYAVIVSGLVAQVYRYRRVATPRERLQTKWVVFGAALSIAGFLTFLFFFLVVPLLNQDILITILGFTVINVFLAGLPLSIGIAILRSHLWDIDIIIRRTLTYGLVVALLAGVYLACVIVLQQVFATVSGNRSEIITVLSTLAIAALFVPLRNRIQQVIDRRFYRKKYDAQKVLNEFSQTVRDETDLELLTARLIEVVDETMQPRSVTVWLRQQQRGK
jgi:hypothetical protein